MNDSKTSAMVVAKKALAQVRSLKRNIEVKMITDNAALVTDVVAAGIVIPLNRIAIGDDFFDRDGNQVTIVKLQTMATLVNTSNLMEPVRIIYFIDLRQQIDATPTVLEVLRVADPLSLSNEARTKRFRVLFDVLIHLNGTRKSEVIRFTRSVNVIQKYNGVNSADIEKNGFYMLLISTATANWPVYTSMHRLSFTDY